MKRPPAPEKLETLTSIQKRDLLALPGMSPEESLVYAEHFLAHEMLDDALEFFVKAGAREGAARIKQAALELGNAGLLFEVAKSGLVEVGRADWEQLGDSAMEMRMFAYALFAYRKSGSEEKHRQAEAHHLPADRPFAEEDEPT